ncbi:helix-turn-helix domain-containing protein [Candidatus Woesearchaeota archaeon]|nr:helix-turn-helix domain-containing protein [Candidatus Woesearchaeota archaeon]
MEKSLFIEFMGDSPTIRILDYLLTERNLDFSLTDIAKNSGIGRTTLYNLLNSLLKHKIIIPTRTIGKAKLYKLNKDNKTIKKLIEVDDTLILENLRKHSEKQKIKITA